MEIIINIPDEDYNLVREHVIDDEGHNVLPINVTYKVVTEIVKGIPLSKGHGRIADIDEIIKCIQEVEGEDAIWAISLIEWACSKRTIIGADEKENEQHVPDKTEKTTKRDIVVKYGKELQDANIIPGGKEYNEIMERCRKESAENGYNPDEIQETATRFARVQETDPVKYSEEDIEQIADAFNILCTVTLFEKMVEKEILVKDPKRPSNILVYMRGTNEHPEGWYSQNVFVAAEDLLSDRQSLKYVLGNAGEHGIDLDEILAYSKATLGE